MAKSFDLDYLKEIRKRFPRIEKDFNGTKRIFIDNGAGSLVLEDAAKAEFRSRIDQSANTDAIYPESKANEEKIEEGRKAVSDLLNSPSSWNIFQGESASELFFRVSYALRNHFGKEGNIVSTYAEHFANVAPLLELRKDGRIGELRLAKLSGEDGNIDISHLASLVDSRTKLIAVTAENNLLGNKTDLDEVSKIAKENDSLLLVDAVHYAPQGLMDVQRWQCDFVVFSAYKVFGPRGSFLYAGDQALDVMRPFYVDRDARPGVGSYLEPGTRDQGVFAAITAVADYISSLSLDIGRFRVGAKRKSRREGIMKGMRRVEAYQEELNRAVLEGTDGYEGLSSMKNVVLYGITDVSRRGERGSTFSFNFKNISDRKAEELYWGRFRMTVVGGSHWNLSHDYYSNTSMLRATFLHYNTLDEVNRFLRATRWISLR